MLTAIKANVIRFDTERTIFYLAPLWVVTVMSEFPECSRLLPPSWWFQEMCSDCSHLVSCKTYAKWIWGRWVQSSQTAMVTSEVQLLRASRINTGNLPEDGTLGLVVPQLRRWLVPHHQEVQSPRLHQTLRALCTYGHLDGSVAPLPESLNTLLQHFSLLISFRSHLHLREILSKSVSTWSSLLHWIMCVLQLSQNKYIL